jgi:ATP-binding cassette subfamily B multidrug efflux pump
MKRVFKWLWPVYKQQGAIIIGVVAVTLLYVASHLSYPYILKLIIDGIHEGLTPHKLTKYVGLLLLFGGGSAIAYAFLQGLRVRANVGAERIIRVRVFNHLTRLGPSFLNRFHSGDIITRLTNDISERLAWFSCSGVFRLVEAVLIIGVGVTILMTINWKLTLLAVCPLPIVGIGFRLLTQRFRKGYERLQKAASLQNDVLEAALSGIRIVKAYCEEPVQRKKYAASVDERVNAEIYLVKMQSLFFNLGVAIGEVGMVILLWIGCNMVIRQSLTLGEMIAFSVYMMMIVEPLWSIGFFLPAIRRADVSVGRLLEIEDAKPEVSDAPGAKVMPPIMGEVAFEGVTFKHGKSDYAGVFNIDCSVPAKGKLGIVGRVGTGKSTLANLIPRGCDPSAGRVTMDGADIRDFTIESVRSGIGYVAQEPFMFSDTIRENLLLGREGFSEDELHRVLKVAQLDDDIRKFPDGMDQMLGPRGVTLSGGQKQRLCIARALLGTPRVLVFDDVTSNLDSDTEAALWRDLHAEFPDVTYVVVSHRAATIQQMDRLVLLDSGRIVERGTHDELVKANGLYAELFRIQLLKEQRA